jgi:hypothetical protein
MEKGQSTLYYNEHARAINERKKVGRTIREGERKVCNKNNEEKMNWGLFTHFLRSLRKEREEKKTFPILPS